MIEPMDALKDKIIMVAKILQQQQVIDGYGHITARLPDNKILSTPHMPPGKVAVRDLIILDADGKKLEGHGEPNGETAMHTSIYKVRPDVQCILHYHADELVALAATGQEIKVISNAGVAFYRGTPIYDSPVLIRNPELGDRVAATLGDKRAVLLRGHGGTIAADNLDQLVRMGLDLVRSAKIQIMAASMGLPIKTHSKEECEAMSRIESRADVHRRFMDYHVSEVVD